MKIRSLLKNINKNKSSLPCLIVMAIIYHHTRVYYDESFHRKLQPESITDPSVNDCDQNVSNFVYY
jgi:hypothetical protein